LEPVPPEINDQHRGSTGIETLLKYLEIIVNRRRLIMVIFSGITFTALLYVLLTRPIYVAKTTILPPGSGNSSPLKGLSNTAQLMGFNLPVSDDFSLLYVPIIKSSRVITKVLKSSFSSIKHKENLPLLDILEIEGERIEERLDTGYKLFLDEILEVNYDRSNRITTIYVGTIEPQLSADIANSLVWEIDKYTHELTIKEAKENKVFIEERLTETLNLLENAEEILKIFRESNKRIEKSPDLQLVQGRLAREVRVQEEVYLTLKKEYEIIKIEEVKSLATLRILDEAVAPITTSRPKRRLIMGLAVFSSLFLSIGIVLGMELFGQIYSNNKHSSMIRKITDPLIEDYNLIKAFSKKVIRKMDKGDAGSSD